MFRAAAGLVLALAGSLAASTAAAQGGSAWDDALRRSQAVIGQPLAEGAERIAFTDTLRRPLTLADLRGRPVVVSLVYTGCFQACPITTQALARVVRSAREALGADSFEVLTIGFNQPFDDPVAMAAFQRQSRIDDPRWRFLSLAAADVPALARALGFSYSATPKGFDHITQATILDAEGKVYRQVYGELPELPQFVGPLKELLSGQAAADTSLDGIWRKVKLYCTVYDPSSGGYRLNYSLFFEIACGLSVLGALAWWMHGERRRGRGA